ncbi:MAG: MarR family winged helix-turn-helix transcriptional regulator [Candidatus Bathyarchaeia archaeon]
MVATTTQQCAHEILEVVPLIMRDIRNQMRNRRTNEFTVPQFRTLTYIDIHKHASLSDVSTHLGITLSSTSKIVDDLVKKEFITRQEYPVDRRRVQLELTSKGLSILAASRQGALEVLSEKIADLSVTEQATITSAMQILRSVFTVNSLVKN